MWLLPHLTAILHNIKILMRSQSPWLELFKSLLKGTTLGASCNLGGFKIKLLVTYSMLYHPDMLSILKSDHLHWKIPRIHVVRISSTVWLKSNGPLKCTFSFLFYDIKYWAWIYIIWSWSNDYRHPECRKHKSLCIE